MWRASRPHACRWGLDFDGTQQVRLPEGFNLTISCHSRDSRGGVTFSSGEAPVFVPEGSNIVFEDCAVATIGSLGAAALPVSPLALGERLFGKSDGRVTFIGCRILMPMTVRPPPPDAECMACMHMPAARRLPPSRLPAWHHTHRGLLLFQNHVSGNNRTGRIAPSASASAVA